MAYTRNQYSQSKHTEFEWDSVGNPIAQRIIGESNEPKAHADETVDKDNKEGNQAELSTLETDENGQTIQAVTEGDRLLSFADIDFDYDDCGNQISELGVGIKTQRGFNAFNQLTSFSKDGVLTQYDYDPLGRRIAKHTEQGQIDFIWDGNQLLGECLNGQYTWYINRPNEFHPIALIKQGEVYYYHLDQLNTPRFVTNQAAEVVWENTANSYGYEDAERESTDFYQPIRFQGQYFDQESRFHYNRFRYYCPKQQRFIHQDPIGIVGGINHYQYAPNPVNWVDPMGLSCKDGAVAALALVKVAPPNPLNNLKTVKFAKFTAQAAANDSVYVAEKIGLSRLLPFLGSSAAFAASILTYSPSAGGKYEEITGPDGTVYSKYSDETVFNAVGSNGDTWSTYDAQEDIAYRTWLANGGDGSIDEWRSLGKPDEGVLIPVVNGSAKLTEQADKYAELVNSNKVWSWKDFPSGNDLSIKQKRAIKSNAIERNLVPDVKFKEGTKYPDFESAGLIEKIDELPEELWKESDYKQFKWLDSRIEGGKPDGFTWHHSEIPGRMELVPFGPHNVINHKGGRSNGNWADSKR